MASYIAAQILANLPTLLVLVVGGIMAIVFMQRAQTASLLTLAGVGIMLVAIIVQVSVSIGASQVSGDSRELWSTIGKGTSVLMGLMRAISLGLIMAGVFVGRGEPAGPQFLANLK
jgi:hypothetical protein